MSTTTKKQTTKKTPTKTPAKRTQKAPTAAKKPTATKNTGTTKMPAKRPQKTPTAAKKPAPKNTRTAKTTAKRTQKTPTTAKKPTATKNTRTTKAPAQVGKTLTYHDGLGKDVRVYKSLPKGYRVLDGTMTQPRGTVWIAKGRPFGGVKDGKLHKNPNYNQALLVKDEKWMIDGIIDRRCGLTTGGTIITNKTTEDKVQAELRKRARQKKKDEREMERYNKKLQRDRERYEAEKAKRQAAQKKGARTKK